MIFLKSGWGSQINVKVVGKDEIDFSFSPLDVLQVPFCKLIDMGQVNLPLDPQWMMRAVKPLGLLV